MIVNNKKYNDTFNVYHSHSLKNQLITFSHLLIKPFWVTEEYVHRIFLPLMPEEYGQQETKTKEISYRIFHVLWLLPALLCTIPFLLLGTCFLTLISSPADGEVLSSDRPSQNKDFQATFSILQGNLCAMRGSLPLPFGGMTPARYRLHHLAEHVLKKEADILAFSELDPLEANPLIKSLSKYYEIIYQRFGLASVGMSSGLMIAVKKRSLLKEETPMTYHPLPLSEKGTQKWFQRGFFSLSIPGYKMIFTHLHPGGHPKDIEQRNRQLEVIETYKKSYPGDSFILLGDLNIDPIHHAEEYQKLIASRGWVPIGAGSIVEPTYDGKWERRLKNLGDYPLQERPDHILSDKLPLKEAKTEIDYFPLERKLSDHALMMTRGIPFKV